MTHDMNEMVAVASGPAATIHQWARLLKRAAIPYHIATTTAVPEGKRSGDAELWVTDALSQEARSVIRSVDVSGAKMLW